ncbi:CsbD family protein [Streptomyces sp. NPDC057854]|uniref:CsbD family protein n=1 Tax=unclassified Streptomyces TaxID=2593676 RepID=UPI003690C779
MSGTIGRAQERVRHEVDRARGRAKEFAGRLSGDERLEAEGRTDRARADLRRAWRSLGARVRGVGDSLRKDRP